MMTTAQVIGIVLTIIGLIFRNQFAQVGDKVVANKKKLWNVALRIVIYGFCVYQIIKAFAIDEFNKLFVFNVLFFSVLLLVSVLTELVAYVFGKIKRFIDNLEKDELEEIEALENQVKNLRQRFETNGLADTQSIATIEELEKQIQERKLMVKEFFKDYPKS